MYLLFGCHVLTCSFAVPEGERLQIERTPGNQHMRLEELNLAALAVQNENIRATGEVLASNHKILHMALNANGA